MRDQEPYCHVAYELQLTARITNQQQQMAYYAARAKGGTGLIITEAQAVSSCPVRTPTANTTIRT
jgi:2,4-dienoyl-CoA reductase-like NADH-dependent reductase (Old Yellow Enzyme family)